MLRNMLVCLFLWTFYKCRFVLEIFNFLILDFFLCGLKMFKCLSKKKCKPIQKAIGLGNTDMDGMLKWRIWGGEGVLHLAKQLMLHIF